MLVVVALVFGIPQGLNSLALQFSVYRQAAPDDIAASAGLLRTFMYLGAITSAALQGGSTESTRTPTACTTWPSVLLIASVALLIVNVLDRSLTRSTAPPAGSRHVQARVDGAD